MMEEIRKRIKKAGSTSRIIGIVALIVLAGLVQVIWNMDLMRFAFTKADVVEYAPNWSSGAFYTCNTNRLLDYYASDDEGYYFFNSYEDADGDFKVMGFYVYNASYDLAMRVVDENEALADTDDYTDLHIKGRGYVYSMSATEKQYMKEYFGEYLAEYEDHLVYDTFVLVPFGKALSFSTIMSILFSVAMLGWAGYLIFSLVTGRCMKKFDEAMEDYRISENALAMDMATAEKVDNIDIGKQYMIVYASTSEVIPFEQLIWAYMNVQTTRHMMYGFIPVGKTVTRSLHLITRDKEKHTISVPQEDTCQEILQKIAKNAPYVIVGYDEQLNQIYTHNFNHMVEMVDEKKNSVVAE